MFTGVFLLNNWIRRGVIRRGMVVSGERISGLGRNAAQHIRSIMSRELASLTLGDAGATVIVEHAPEGEAGISSAGFTTLSEHSRLCLASPARHQAGPRMFTQARAIHRAAIAAIPPLFREVLDANDIGLDDVDFVIPHQTSTRAIRKGMVEIGAALGGSPKQPAVVTVDQFGNTASTTHFVALYELMRNGQLHPGERVALLALASGLEIGVVDVHDRRDGGAVWARRLTRSPRSPVGAAGSTARDVSPTTRPAPRSPRREARRATSTCS